MGPMYIVTPFTFPKGIKLKVNVIARLEFELAYYDAAVQKVRHYAMGDSPSFYEKKTTILRCGQRKRMMNLTNKYFGIPHKCNILSTFG